MSDEGDEKPKAKSVDIHYIKSNLYRVIHADGAYGGVTSRGYLHLALYNERRAIPRITTVSVDADTHEPRETIKESRSGVVREIEIGALLDEQFLGELIEWLQGKQTELRNVKKLIAELAGKNNG